MRNKYCKGLTIIELLVVVVIMIIFMSVSAVAATKHMRNLKLIELDNMAKEIYMSSQNRAVSLYNNGRLEERVVFADNLITANIKDEEGNDKDTDLYYIYYKPNQDHSDLLPSGSIDPKLKDNFFYVVYEPKTGSVTDVFFTEEEIKVDDFQGFYNIWRAAPAKIRMSNNPIIGYYGGETAQNSSTGALYTPIITIDNKEELTLKVSYSVPITAASATNLSVTLSYGGKNIELVLENENLNYNNGAANYSYSWVLDSLKSGKQFKDLFGTVTSGFGGDFTATATVNYSGISSSTATVSDNSLFAKGSGGNTAKIEYLRHIQNIDENFSGVKNKTSAEQIANIMCSNYDFIPIQNDSIKKYDGCGNLIQKLNITPKSAENKTGAGLFAQTNDTEFLNLSLVDTTINTDVTATGAFVGNASNTKFTNCYVYWQRDIGTSNLRGKLGNNEDGYNYSILGEVSGGIAGIMDGGIITNCFAATLIKGETVGGLIGTALNDIEINNSYSDCYLYGKNAAGLVGNNLAEITAKNAYTAGFIDMSECDNAAGVCLGNGSIKLNGVYSVMRYTDKKDNAVIINLADKISAASEKYYSLAVGTGADEHTKTYADMTNEDFQKELGAEFEFKERNSSEPYNLRTDLDLSVYDFPGIKDIPHYGDWGAQFQKASLVYYEQYEDNSFGFQGGGVASLKNNIPVIDGYAVAMLKSELPSAGMLKIDYTHLNNAAETVTTTENYDISYLDTVESEDGSVFCIAPIPESIVNVDYAAPNFYQPLNFSYSIEGVTNLGNYYYNPHFAGTAVETEDEAPDAKSIPVTVRTPRHLRILSAYDQYYHNDNSYTFNQELDLVYSKYTGYGNKFSKSTQSPIGRQSSPFNGTYDGHSFSISEISFDIYKDSDRAYAGLFGYSTGTIRNVVYNMDYNKELVVTIGNSAVGQYLGGLVGGNMGSVINCAVSGANLKGMAYGGIIYVGGLVGQNSGIIQNSAAEVGMLSTDSSNFASSYVGGLVGENATGGTIEYSYSVGRVTSEVDSTSLARVCGFVGYNRSYIKDSYAAVNLRSSGLNVETYAFCGITEGSQTGTVYLNRGNFTYRDISYNASYTPKKAAEKTYSQMTEPSPDNENVSNVINTMALGGLSADFGGVYPYPATVKDAKGNYVHYGSWPTPMELGVMGVYYWEKLEVLGRTTYDVSLLAVDAKNKTVIKQTTLSNSYSDGGVVTDYGYGYYSSDDVASVLGMSASGINYSVNKNAGVEFKAPMPQYENANVNNVLKSLMGDYTFHSYHSFGLAQYGGGMYPSEAKSGSINLYQGTINVEFNVNPHFADAISVKNIPYGWEEIYDQNIIDEPGNSNFNPYEIRAISQLQNINWNLNKINTNTVIEKDNYTHFPYLSYAAKTEKIYWQQTHDIKGDSSTYFTPIAEYYDETSGNLGNLYAWFGGVYDGGGYMIENVNIHGQESSCAGLFGIVYNGELKDIILYSSDGNGTVEAYSGGTKSAWYSIGVLAGMAASDSGSSIQNCSVAGYTINVKARLNTGSWGGIGAGGLVGISSMSLTGCSAITDINVPSEAFDKDNMRIGGLVGTCQRSIENCYSGGSINIDSQAAKETPGIYIGGIVGGSYFKPLDVFGTTKRIGVVGDPNNKINETNNAITNCYSYVTLPAKNANSKIKALYALGGTGEIYSINNIPSSGDTLANHGVCTIENSYYLSSEALKNNTDGISGIKTDINGTAGVTSLSYEQLSSEENVNGYNIYSLLTAFSPVTSTTDDGEFSLSGKYSYAPSRYTELKGLDYPFPTILTRENGAYNVHYGSWPMNGIKRLNGATPIELDLFVNNSSQETLSLVGNAQPNGTWNVVSEDNNIAVGNVDKYNVLTVTGKGVGHTTLTINYSYGGKTYSIRVVVNVTAVLEFRPNSSPVNLFTNDTTSISLTPYGKNNTLLNLGDLGIDIKEFKREGESEYFEYINIEQTENGLKLNLKTTNSDVTAAVENVRCKYTHNEIDYSVLNPITFRINKPDFDYAVPPVEINLSSGKPTVYFNVLLPNNDTNVVINSRNIKVDNETIVTAVLDNENVLPNEVLLTLTGHKAGETNILITIEAVADERTHILEISVPVVVIN